MRLLSKKVYILCTLIILTGSIFVIQGKSEFPNSKKIKGQEIDISNDLGRPRYILALDSVLIIIDEEPITSEHKIKVYDINNFNIVDLAGKQGKGPEEILRPEDMNRNLNIKNSFSVYDNPQKKLNIYEFKDGKLNYLNYIFLKAEMPFSPSLLKHNKVISPGLTINEDKRFYNFNSNGDLTHLSGQILTGKEEHIPYTVHSQASDCVFRVTPDGKRYISALKYTDKIEIMDTTGKLVKRIIGPKDKDPSYKVRMSGSYPLMQQLDEQQMYYLDIDVTNNLMYALYSGNNHMDEYVGKYIQVFDMDGNELAVYELEQKVSQITYVKNRNSIVGLNVEDAKVYEFELPNKTKMVSSDGK